MRIRNVVLSLSASLLLCLPFSAKAQSAGDELIAAAKKGDVAAVKAALAKGADVNTRTNYGATALHFAADRGHLEVVKTLVEAGADANAKDDFYKMTPVAMAMMHSQKEVAEYLQKVIVEKKQSDQNAQSAPPSQTAPAINPKLNEEILTAAKRGELAKVKDLLAKGADVNAKTNYSQTPLMFAAQNGHLEVVKTLVEAGADLDVVDTFYKSFTALSAAAQGNHTEVIRFLIGKGAKGKENVLVIAAMEGNRDVVDFILQNGGLNQQILDVALLRANEAEQKETAELLKKAGAKLAGKKELKSEVEIDAPTLQKYAGQYRLDEARQYTFIVQNGKLSGWDVRQYSFPLTAIDKNIFRIGNDDSRTIVFNEENNRIVSITVTQGGFKQTYNRVEGK